LLQVLDSPLDDLDLTPNLDEVLVDVEDILCLGHRSHDLPQFLFSRLQISQLRLQVGVLLRDILAADAFGAHVARLRFDFLENLRQAFRGDTNGDVGLVCGSTILKRRSEDIQGDHKSAGLLGDPADVGGGFGWIGDNQFQIGVPDHQSVFEVDIHDLRPVEPLTILTREDHFLFKCGFFDHQRGFNRLGCGCLRRPEGCTSAQCQKDWPEKHDEQRPCFHDRLLDHLIDP
jgi:hypothetical protein